LQQQQHENAAPNQLRSKGRPLCTAKHSKQVLCNGVCGCRVPSCSPQKPNYQRMATIDTAARTQTCQQAPHLLFYNRNGTSEATQYYYYY
jgi:hypothetical protein